MSYSDLNAATQGPSYLGYYTLDSYDPVACQQYCDDIEVCYAFNIYFERDPSEDSGPSCPNPPSTINIKCALFGAFLDGTTATDEGQLRDQFQVVVRGSNGQ